MGRDPLQSRTSPALRALRMAPRWLWLRGKSHQWPKRRLTTSRTDAGRCERYLDLNPWLLLRGRAIVKPLRETLPIFSCMNCRRAWPRIELRVMIAADSVLISSCRILPLSFCSLGVDPRDHRPFRTNRDSCDRVHFSGNRDSHSGPSTVTRRRRNITSHGSGARARRQWEFCDRRNRLFAACDCNRELHTAAYYKH